MNKPEETTILGRHVGTSTGWDQGDTFAIVLYDFKPAEGIDIPAGDLNVDYDTGKMSIWKDDGSGKTWEADMITVLAKLPQVLP